MAPALQSLYQRKADIVTRGFSGYNSNQAVLVLKEMFRADNAALGDIKLMTIFFGTNDAAFTDQAVPLDKYKQNMQAMVDLVKSYGIGVVIVGMALYDKKLAMQVFGEDRGSCRNQRLYADAAKGVAEDNDVPFIDLWTAFQEHGKWSTEDLLNDSVDLSSLLGDGLHFSGAGYRVFYDKLVDTIHAHFPHLAPDKLDMIFPDHSDLDMKNSERDLTAWLNG